MEWLEQRDEVALFYVAHPGDCMAVRGLNVNGSYTKVFSAVVVIKVFISLLTKIEKFVDHLQVPGLSSAVDTYEYILFLMCCSREFVGISEILNRQCCVYGTFIL